MHAVQRKFGTLMKRSDEGGDVGTAMHEFNQTGKILATLIESTKAFRDAWEDILRQQLYVADAFEGVYKPMEGTSVTPRQFMEKTVHLRAAYYAMQTDLKAEVGLIETKLLRPATEAKDAISPLKKMIKKRNDLKSDYERHQSHYETARHRDAATLKEENAIARAEADYQQSQYDYQQADDHLKEVLPPIIDAVSRFIPELLTTQIMLQHTLVAQLYTVLHGFCEQHQFTVPAPEYEQVIATFEREFTPLRHEVESEIQTLKNGKAIGKPMSLPDYQGSTLTGMNLRNRVRGGSNGPSADGEGSSLTGLGIRNKVMSGGKSAMAHGQSHNHSQDGEGGSSLTGFGIRHKVMAGGKSAYEGGSRLIQERRTSSRESVPQVNTAHARQSAVYADDEAAPVKPPRPGSMTLANRSPSQSKPGSPYGAHRTSSPIVMRDSPSESDHFPSPSSASTAQAIAGKKKPPPPPVKRMPSTPDLHVTALYDFVGQSQGDLSFREGDQIRIVRKTQSTDDWWTGELRGVEGSFPANYCR